MRQSPKRGKHTDSWPQSFKPTATTDYSGLLELSISLKPEIKIGSRFFSSNKSKMIAVDLENGPPQRKNLIRSDNGELVIKHIEIISYFRHPSTYLCRLNIMLLILHYIRIVYNRHLFIFF